MGKNAQRRAKLKVISKNDGRKISNQIYNDNFDNHIKFQERDLAADEYFQVNNDLGPPYHVIMDTSFLNYSITYRLDLINECIKCLSAKVTLYVTDCVMSELEKNAHRFGIALKLAKDPRVKRLKCTHQNIGYADDCLCKKAEDHRCYMIATNDRELRRRVRKIPGIPLLYAKRGRVEIERLPEADML
ncbi:putative rRNA-processing protein FCF1 [Spironucleus salmonicida]|uniref:rRNA-processing protein FCF1 n=2 Tax=Spironucleus TaxID=39709 RepID=V6LYW8_9EUKA|nr:putative rRNA-processing protein FCF1 [Spironucleus salmonicida]|eukprot:EST46024.1 rRNA-processing protein FCF1 [Spironucleus salmonicida]